MQEELKTLPKRAYQKCFEDWKKHWQKCIISEGDYFDFNTAGQFLKSDFGDVLNKTNFQWEIILCIVSINGIMMI